MKVEIKLLNKIEEFKEINKNVLNRSSRQLIYKRNLMCDYLKIAEMLSICHFY